MFSFNLAKLLSCCKVLPSSSIILSSQCACHQKISLEHNLDLLLDGPEPIFRCISCGDSLCATSYMLKKMGLSQEQVYENLLIAELSPNEANSLIYRATKYLRLLRTLDLGRKKYRERSEADDRRHKKYGDWAEVSGATLNDLFFRKAITKVNPKSSYTVLTLRDENGIPSKGYLYTLMGSFVGEVEYPIVSGNIHSVSERWTDLVSWQTKIIAAQDPALVQLLSKSITEEDGQFNYPVIMPFCSTASAKYFSRVYPKISLILADNEAPGLCTSMHTEASPVDVYKLPGVIQTGFGLSGKIDEELSRMKPQTIAQSIVSGLKEEKRLSLPEFIKTISRMGHSSISLRDMMVNEYCKISKEDNRLVRSSIKQSSIGFSEVNLNNKIFKLSHGKYFQRQPDLGYTCISNFWAEIDHVVSDGKKDIQYFLRIHLKDKSCEIYINDNVFSSSKKLFQKITNACLLNGLECPTWNSTKYVQAFLPQIIRGLSGTDYPFYKKDEYGFIGRKFCTEKYICSANGIKLIDGHVGQINQAIKHPNYLLDLPKYRETSIENIRSLCDTEFGAACLVGALEIVLHLYERGRAHLVAPLSIAQGVASLLGIQKQDELTSTNMIQYVDKSINHKTLLKHRATISLFDLGSTPHKRCIYFKDSPQETLLLNSDTLLLFFCEIVFVLGPSRALKHIETILQKNSRVAKFRLMRRKINGIDHALTEFIDTIKIHSQLHSLIEEIDEYSFINIRIFKELKKLGYSFSKNDIIDKTRQKYSGVKYPHILRGGTHKTGFLVKIPNIFQNINTTTECTTRHLSLQ